MMSHPAPPLPTPVEIIAHLDRFVRGQVRAKRDLAVAVYGHYLSQCHRDREGADLGRQHLGWDGTTGSARQWWEAFEQENQHRPALVLRLAEELKRRQATIAEFFLAYVYSNTDNIQANLHYLDYSRLKREQEKKPDPAE